MNSTPSFLAEAIVKCESAAWPSSGTHRTRRLECAAEDWVRQASLAIVHDWDDKPELAVVQAEKAIAMGQRTYDLFGAYAASLEKVERGQR